MTLSTEFDVRTPFARATRMRFSGHETFAIRYTWIPKAYRYMLQHPDSAFQDEEGVMVELGLGKNMVLSLRFWLEAFELATSSGNGLTPTGFAHAILAADGLDPFLESPSTLWLLHANLCMRPADALCAWEVLVNRWNKGEFSKSEAVRAFRRESEFFASKPYSEVTLGQHFDAFVHTYVPSHAADGSAEESLDCPLAELAFVEPSGERREGPDGRRETIYRFNRDPKPEINAALFEYVVNRMFVRHRDGESSRTFRELLYGPWGPGQVFRLPEDDLRARLEELSGLQSSRYTLQLSAVQIVLRRKPSVADEARNRGLEDDLLKAVYDQGTP